MKKWNKKMCIFFSLFFILSFLVYPSFSVLASDGSQPERYTPTDLESQCYRFLPDVNTKYDYAELTSYYYGSKGSIVVGYLQNDGNGETTVCLSSVGNLANPKSEYVWVKNVFNHYDKDNKLVSVVIQDDRGAYFNSYLCSYDNFVSMDVHMKVFASLDSAVRFAKTGDESGLISDSSELTDSNSVYAPEIGYLQNVQIHTRGVKDDDGETDYLTYDSISNTGFDITQDGVRVSLYTKYQGYYFENWTEWIGDDNAHKWVSDRRYQKSVDGSLNKFFYEYRKLFDVHEADKIKNESLNQSLLATPFGKIEYWLRIEKKNSDGTWAYGGWVSMADTKASMTEGDKQTKTYDNEENLDPDGGYGTGTDTYQDYGEGNTVEEADEKAFELPDSQKDLDNYDSGYDTMDSFVDGIKSMKNGLGDVPKIISEVFKALPVPVISAIGCGFFLAIVLRILGR